MNSLAAKHLIWQPERTTEDTGHFQKPMYWEDLMTTKICSSCFRELPIPEFRKRSRSEESRSPQCRKCHNEAERLRYQKKRGALRCKALSECLYRLRRDSSDQQVRTLCEQMVNTFGGISGLVEAWKQCWEADLTKQRSKTFLHLEALVRLMQWVEANRPDFNRLTDTELAAAISETRARLLS